MALKAVVDSLDAVDASLHSLYVKTEAGKFRLDVDGGFQTNEEAAGLLASVKSTRAERDEALARLKPLQDALHGVEDVAGFISSAKTMASELEAFKGKDKDTSAKFDQLKANYENQLKETLGATKASFEEKLNGLTKQVDAKSNLIRKLSIDAAIAGSEFLNSRSYVTGAHAVDILGKHFEAKDDGDRVTVIARYPDGAEVYSQENPGQLAGPQEAIRLLMPKHYSALLKDTSGAGSPGGGGGTSTAGTVNANDLKAFGNNLEAIAKGSVKVQRAQ